MADKEVLDEFKSNRFDYFNTIMDNKTPIEINRVEKMVLISLIRHNNWKTGICNPTIKTIQNEWFYHNDREIIKALRSLKEKNFFTKQTIKRRNYYQLNIGLLLNDYLQNDGNCLNDGNLQNDSNNNCLNDGDNNCQNEGTNRKETEKEQKNIYSPLDSETYVNEINKELEKDLLKKIKSKYSKELIKDEFEKLKDKHINELDLLKELEKNLKVKEKELNKKNKSKSKEKIYIDLTFIDDVIDKVKITKEQYDKLINKFNKELVHNQILQLDNYIINGKGKKYKDHYRALNTWCNKNNKNFKPKEISISDEDIEF